MIFHSTHKGSHMWRGSDIINALNFTAIDTGFTARNIAIDTRTLQPDDIFVCIAGDKFDGHDFINDAIEKGASLIIASKPEYVSGAKYSYLLVDDTLEALRQLARFARNHSKANVIAVTGSAGKTTTKEFLSQVLSQFGKTVASPKSYNNHWGVPLSLSRLDQDADFGVFELGMNNGGEIAPLTAMVKPNIAIITTIAEAHIGHLGSLDAIATEKATIFEGLVPGGIAIINADVPQCDYLRACALKAGASRVVTVGEAEAADVRLITYDINENASTTTAMVFGKNVTFTQNALGKHYAYTALITLAVTTLLDLPLSETIAHIKKLKPVAGRGQIKSITFKGQSITVIDDAYNANPASMRAGLDILKTLPSQGRKIVVLGEMLEMGEFSEAAHRSLGEYINALNINYVFATGDAMRHATAAINTCPAEYMESVEAIKARLSDEIKTGDILFIKGSNGSKVHQVVDFLLDDLRKVA